MIRLSIRLSSALALAALSMPVLQAAAQQDVPAAPAAAPAAPAVAAPIFPKPDPANFTAAFPDKDTLNDFLQASWGYDDSRVWEIWAIQKTQAEGVSRVTILVGDKSGKQKPMVSEFLALQDGKHIIVAGEVIPFGKNPFAESRILAQKADGPYRGSPAKDLEIVEFADFQCPHCKDAQANMDKLAVDFPKARIVFQNLPLAQHPAAGTAAAYGLCVAKQGGSNAFFTYAASVFEGQDGLATADGATLTLNSAVTKVGLEPAKIAECAATKEILATIEASKRLAQDLNINQTPTLIVNGCQVPATAPYETIKRIVEYRAKMDGVAAH